MLLGARRVDRLEALAAEIGGSYAALDVTSRASFETFVSAAVERYGRVDELVNNAGVMPLSLMDSLKVDEWDRMLDVNVRGVLNGLAAVLPRFGDGGHVVNVASIGAHMVMPTAAVYCATKYAVWALSEGLRQERSDLRVTVISPGVTESELADTITESHAAASMEDFRKIALPASAIGEAILYAVSQPSYVDVNEAGMSTRTLNRRFREQTGTTPLQWLHRARIRQAQHLLETTKHPVELIASRVGFGSPTAFRDRFKRVAGTSPNAYRAAFQG